MIGAIDSSKIVTSKRVYIVTSLFLNCYGHHSHIVVKKQLFQTNKKIHKTATMKMYDMHTCRIDGKEITLQHKKNDITTMYFLFTHKSTDGDLSG